MTDSSPPKILNSHGFAAAALKKDPSITPYRIGKMLNEAGYRTASGAEYQASTVKSLLEHPEKGTLPPQAVADAEEMWGEKKKQAAERIAVKAVKKVPADVPAEPVSEAPGPNGRYYHGDTRPATAWVITEMGAPDGGIIVYACCCVAQAVQVAMTCPRSAIATSFERLGRIIVELEPEAIAFDTTALVVEEADEAIQ